MSLYTRMFGRICMAPAEDDGSDLGGAEEVVDRGDNFDSNEESTVEDEDDGDDEVVADLTKADTPRDAGGKFTKKEKAQTDDEPRIPKSRFDEAVQKERERAEAAERRIAEYEASKAATTQTATVEAQLADLRELRRAERAALLSNDLDEAERLSDQVDALNRQIAVAQATTMSTADRAQAREQDRMDEAVAELTGAYPMLDQNSEEFDQGLVDTINDIQVGIMQRERLSPSRALRKAAGMIMASRVTTEPASVETSVNKAEQRKADAVKRNLATSQAQPANQRLAGADSDKFGQKSKLPSAGQMTYDEFSALPETTKAQMRGDFLAA